MLNHLKKAIFAAIIISLASGAGAASLTIAEKLQDIMNSKEAIRQAIESKGTPVPVDTPLSQYADKIRQNVWRAHDSLRSICSDPTDTSKFPYVNCTGRTYSDYNWEATSCPLASGTASIYGNARCSNTGGTLGVQGNPTNNNGSGIYCWCQLCSNSSRTSCGGWVSGVGYSWASYCTSGCASDCGNFVGYILSGNRAFRSALCAP